MSAYKKQRVGTLIEQFVCDKYNLSYNKRQRAHGFFDCYDEDTLYEIKASNVKSNRFIIDVDNHNKLFLANGKYIFIVYQLIDKDHDLQLITDIDIKQIKIIDSQTIDSILLKHREEQYSKKNTKRYKRIRINEVL